MCFHRYWRRYYRKLPFFERFLRAGRYSNEIPRTDRHNTGEHKHWAWLDDIILVTKGNMDKHEAEVRETMTKMEQIGQWTNWKELPKSTYQKAKKNKVILGGNPILIKIHGKSVSKYRHSGEIVEETKQLDMDRRAHQSVKQSERRYYKDTMLSALQRTERKHNYH